MIKLQVFLIMVLLLSKSSFAQNRTKYCSCNVVGSSISSDTLFKDSLYTYTVSDSNQITVVFANTTADTIYIFNSYLQKTFLSSKYLHRINSFKNEYKISFVPLIPFVFTKYSDILKIGDDAIIGNHQIVYDFYTLLPKSKFELNFYYRDLFKENRKNSAVIDINIKRLNKYNDQVKFKTAKVHNLNGQYKFLFEFAAYKSINVLCNQSAYYVNEYLFDKQSKEFELIQIPFEVPRLHK
jgi:hypothetical protein